MILQFFFTLALAFILIIVIAVRVTTYDAERRSGNKPFWVKSDGNTAKDLNHEGRVAYTTPASNLNANEINFVANVLPSGESCNEELSEGDKSAKATPQSPLGGLYFRTPALGVGVGATPEEARKQGPGCITKHGSVGVTVEMDGRTQCVPAGATASEIFSAFQDVNTDTSIVTGMDGTMFIENADLSDYPDNIDLVRTGCIAATDKMLSNMDDYCKDEFGYRYGSALVPGKADSSGCARDSYQAVCTTDYLAGFPYNDGRVTPCSFVDETERELTAKERINADMICRANFPDVPNIGFRKWERMGCEPGKRRMVCDVGYSGGLIKSN